MHICRDLVGKTDENGELKEKQNFYLAHRLIIFFVVDRTIP
jgi:hypothetical protein